MVALNKPISGFAQGDHLEVKVPVTNIPTGQVLYQAWFTVKRKAKDLDEDCLIQKLVTTTDVPGTGQITDDGALDLGGELRFDLLPADTRLVVKEYPYDVQVRTDAGKVYTVVIGTIKGEQDVTIIDA